MMDMKQNTLQLLIISIGNQRYGIDIEQVDGLTNLDVAEFAVGFEQLLASESGGKCNYSKMLRVKARMEVPILISEPDEVVIVSIGDICRLPEILMIPAGKKGAWGLLTGKHDMIILIDFYKNQEFERLNSSTMKYYEAKSYQREG